jgi:L-arabinose isomerase
MGNRFRMIVHDVDCVAPEAKLKKLPVASALWIPQPDMKTGATAWIYAGGAHHNAFSQAVTAEYIEDFCEIADIELVQINKNTCIADLKNELKWNEMYYLLAKGL